MPRYTELIQFYGKEALKVGVESHPNSQDDCGANHMTSFYMKWNTRVKYYNVTTCEIEDLYILGDTIFIFSFYIY